MKLYYSNTSPYSRKVRIALLETKLWDKIEGHIISPFEDGAANIIPSPLGQIPTLEISPGNSLYDSRVICAYINSLSENSALIPEAKQWEILRQQALGDGIIDASYNIVMESRRNDAEQSEHWLDRWRTKIATATQSIKVDHENFDLGTITIACALGYLDFRIPEIDWRSGNPELADWFEGICQRSSFQATVPPQ